MAGGVGDTAAEPGVPPPEKVGVAAVGLLVNGSDGSACWASSVHAARNRAATRVAMTGRDRRTRESYASDVANPLRARNFPVLAWMFGRNGG